MENIISNRRKALELEKEHIQKQLGEISFEKNMNRWLRRCFELSITSMNQSKGVKLEKLGNGILVHSSLKEEEDRYFHFKEAELLGELIAAIEFVKDQLIALNFEGYAKDCNVELRLTFIDNTEKEEEVRLLVGEKTTFSLHNLQSINQVKVRIHLKGSGSAFIRNPQFIVKKKNKLESSSVEQVLGKTLEDLCILHVEKDAIVKKFDSISKLISITESKDKERISATKPDVWISSSCWLETPGCEHNSGYVNYKILYDLLYSCVEHNVTTVFWDVNPPEHVSTMVHYAKYFDYVLTTNKESIAEYKNAGCKHVDYLPLTTPLHPLSEKERYYLKRIVFSEQNLRQIDHPSIEEDNLERKKERLLALRVILEKYTIKAKLTEIIERSHVIYKKEPLSATMIAKIKSKRDYEVIVEIFKRQTMQNKKLVLLLDYFDGYLDILNYNNTSEIKSYILDYIHHYDNINDLIETSHFAPISTKHFYGKNYLKDLSLTTLYSRDAIIVKNVGPEYTFITKGQFDRAFIPKSFSQWLNPSEFIQLFDEVHHLEKWFMFGAQFFNADNFNLIHNCEEPDASDLINIEI